MRNKALTAFFIGCGLVAGLGSTSLALAQPTDSLPASPAPPDPALSNEAADDRSYEAASRALLDGEYDLAIAGYEKLFLGPSPRKATVAYGLGQSHRFKGNFVESFFYYRRSADAYEKLGELHRPEVEKWLTVVERNLTLVTVQVPEKYRGKFCQVEVDGVPLMESPSVAVASLMNAERFKASTRNAVKDSPEYAWLGGFRHARSASDVSAERCPRSDFALLLSTNSDHRVEFRWQATQGERQSLRSDGKGRLDVLRTNLEKGTWAISIDQLKASFTLDFGVVQDLDESSVTAFLRAAKAKKSYRISQERRTPVPAGTYLVNVDVENYDVRSGDGDRLVLLPGEQLSLPVELKEPVPFWKKPGWIAVGAGLVVVGVVVGAVVITNDDDPAPRGSVNQGSLGWSVRVP